MTDKILEALEIGLDLARSAAEEFHQKFVGYKAEEHKVVDDDVRKIEEAIEFYKEQSIERTVGQTFEDGWIPWGGGILIAGGWQEVEVRCRNGVMTKSKANDLEWRHCLGEGDIVAYRVIQEKGTK